MKKVLGKTGLEISPIGLGTVEIGLAYGIGTKEIPSAQEANTILKSAVAMGVTYIDTARGYGLAEERIGKSGIGNMPGVVIGTKCGQFLKNEPDLHGVELAKRVREDIETSRQMLQRDVLQLVQFHNELPDYTDFREIIDILQKLKDEGKIEHVGMATRGQEAPLAAIQSGFFETLQVAHNILDQRMVPHVLPKAQENNVGIINRSVLLQGVLSPAMNKLPPALASLKTQAEKAHAIAKEAGMDLPTLAFRFVISNPATSTALLGTTKPSRLQAALDATNAGPLPQDILDELKALALTDVNLIDPGKWPKPTS